MGTSRGASNHHITTIVTAHHRHRTPSSRHRHVYLQTEKNAKCQWSVRKLYEQQCRRVRLLGPGSLAGVQEISTLAEHTARMHKAGTPLTQPR
jgi:hypothetical protein